MGKKTVLFIVKRLVIAVVTIFLIATITFFVMNAIPGGPFNSEKSVSPETMAALNKKYGLDKPLIEQYGNYLKNIIRLDFGPSLKQKGRSVNDILVDGLKTSVKLGLAAAFLAVGLGLILGTTAAVFRKRMADKAIMLFTTASVAMPSFVIGTFLLIIFGLYLNWFPVDGSLKGGMVMPIVALALYPTAYITRLTRTSMLDIMGQDFIRTAKAKGVGNLSVIYKHTLRNALIPVITYVGPMIAYIVTGSLVVEQIFSVPGLGRAFTSSIINRDYTLIMGTTIVLATLVVLMNLVSDIMYKVVDPRVDLN
ncbi:MAG: ABC transporter permease [Clostridia bacterium]|nr:ABC transporter permease [Clostridia bacterium]